MVVSNRHFLFQGSIFRGEVLVSGWGFFSFLCPLLGLGGIDPRWYQNGGFPTKHVYNDNVILVGILASWLEGVHPNRSNSILTSWFVDVAFVFFWSNESQSWLVVEFFFNKGHFFLFCFIKIYIYIYTSQYIPWWKGIFNYKPWMQNPVVYQPSISWPRLSFFVASRLETKTLRRSLGWSCFQHLPLVK